MTADDRKQLPILLTGATGAIGRQIALKLAKTEPYLILACRSEKKFDKLLDDIQRINKTVRIDFLKLDLASEDSVKHAARLIKDTPLRAIINNAGIMCRHYTVTADGHETTMAVNYHNTKILNENLLRNLVDSDAPIVFTTSLTRFMPPYTDKLPDEVSERQFGQLSTYALSKKLITRYAGELAQRGYHANCADPGIVNTGMIRMDRWFDRLADIFFRPFIRTPRQGAESTFRALHSEESGLIFCRKAIHKIKLAKKN
jgi:short-subunit dehydrogenase